MNEINLYGRLPEDLPNKMTINDILLELKDTDKFDIKWIQLNDQITNIGTPHTPRTIKTAIWRSNNKSFDQFVEHGQVSVFRCDYVPTFDLEWSVKPTTSNMRVKEYRYDIYRYPIRLSVEFKAGILSLNKGAKEIIDTSNDVYLRLKDYLGPDVIQDQIQLTNFTIDFLISEVTQDIPIK